MTDSTSRMLSRTRRRLFVVTLGLVALLVVGIGVATAAVALRALDVEVDRALASSVDAASTALHDGLPSSSETGGDGEDTTLASSDTFLLILGPDGKIVSNPSRVNLHGLPDEAAVEAARALGRDLRTVDAGGTNVRLLTVAIKPDEQAKTIGFVQGGFVLDLHDQQSRSILVAILLVAAVGLIGAAFVTLIVTGRAIDPIRRSFESQRRFVADASHELRTPTALIRANADVLERERLMAEEGKPLVADIITEADRLARLVGELLQLAASETTEAAVELRPVDLRTIATDTIRQTTALATSRRANLVMQTTAATPAVVNGDHDRLVQLLLILLDNALDHSPPDGTVTVAIQRTDGNVELVVADEGPGIAVSEREHVFEPFTRLRGVRRDRSSGTGLGLAIARRITTAHRGTIRIDDAPGGGAAVVVSIPAAGDLPAP
jgi:signal transduction histidine kinase